jgi:cytochrome c oxidase subunit 5b
MYTLKLSLKFKEYFLTQSVYQQMSRDRPIERCPECGNVLKMDYVGPTEDAHGHDHHGHDAHGDGAHHYEGEPKTFADFVRPEYR